RQIPCPRPCGARETRLGPRIRRPCHNPGNSAQPAALPAGGPQTLRRNPAIGTRQGTLFFDIRSGYAFPTANDGCHRGPGTGSHRCTNRTGHADSPTLQRHLCNLLARWRRQNAEGRKSGRLFFGPAKSVGSPESFDHELRPAGSHNSDIYHTGQAYPDSRTEASDQIEAERNQPGKLSTLERGPPEIESRPAGNQARRSQPAGLRRTTGATKVA